MAKRVQMSMSDYLVLAITPGLLIAMISALAFYLIACFYGGEHVLRLKIIAFLFVMGAVLTCRIAIEDSKEYAALFVLPLGGVVFIAAQRFVQLGPFLNLTLIVVIWWTAWKLTWDSTVIDDTQSSSGEGLLETLEHQSPDVPPEATTGSDAEDQNGPEQPFWKSWLVPDQRPHNPGRWLILYALGSLPLLALGNWSVPTANRPAAFQALAIYVACALAVLLSTSFLGLRKYLRQRRLEMPMDMAAVWLGSGAALILAVMISALLLPRPGVRLASETAWSFGNERLQQASNYATGNDSADSQQGQPGSIPEENDSEPSGNQTGSKQSSNPDVSKQESGGKQSDGKQAGGKQAGGKQAGGKQAGGKQAGGKQAGGKQAGGKQAGGKQSDGKQSDGKQSDGKQSGGKQSGGKQSDGKQSDDKQSGGKQSGGKQAGGKQSDGKQSDESGEKQSEGGSRERATENAPERQRDAPNGKQRSEGGQRIRSTSSRSILPRLPAIGIRFIYWIGLIAIMAYLLVRYHKEVLAAMEKFISDIKKLWNDLFGRQDLVAENSEQVMAASNAAPEVGFSDFTNPFRDGHWKTQPARDVVQYTFAAAEAWGSEHECARDQGQTPLEFARKLGAVDPDLGKPASALGQLYNHAAYAPRDLPAQSARHLELLWEILEQLDQSSRLPPAPPAPPIATSNPSQS